jgi:osmotically-inducible protein OsmY
MEVFAKASWWLWVLVGLAFALASWGFARRRRTERLVPRASQYMEADADLGAYDLSSVAERAHRSVAPNEDVWSDLSIAREINERIRMEDTFLGTSMRVSVRTGHVSLWGTVSTDHQRARASAVAGTIAGVVDVDSTLQLRE